MDERKLQYDRCRVEKNRCEKLFSYCMAGILLLGVVELFTYGFMEILMLAGGKKLVLYALILRIPYLVLAVLGVAKREWHLCAAAIAVFLGICVFDGGLGGFSFVVPIAMLIICRTWERLKNEEGFPRFEFDEVEHAAEQQRAQEMNAAMGHSVGQGSAQRKAEKNLPARNLPQVEAAPDTPQQITRGEMDTI